MRWVTSRPMSANISSRAPTSTPRVGSSRIRIFGGCSIHLPTTTLCWLPPESVAIAASGLLALIANPSIARLDDGVAPLVVGQAAAGPQPRPRQRQVEADGLRHHEAVALAVLRHEGDSRGPRVRRTAQPHGTSPDGNFAGRGGHEPGEHVRQFRPARADQSRQAQHFAAVQLKTNVVHPRRPAGRARSVRLRPGRAADGDNAPSAPARPSNG